MRFTPTSGWWLNRVDRFSRDRPANRRRCAICQGLEELILAIGNDLEIQIQSPNPFLWTAKASDILKRAAP
jgi:hypothetical protein